MPARLGGAPSTSPRSRVWASTWSVPSAMPSNGQYSLPTTLFESRSSSWIRSAFAWTLCLQESLQSRESAFWSAWSAAKSRPIRGVGASPSGAVNRFCSRRGDKDSVVGNHTDHRSRFACVLRPQLGGDSRRRVTCRAAPEWAFLGVGASPSGAVNRFCSRRGDKDSVVGNHTDHRSRFACEQNLL